MISTAKETRIPSQNATKDKARKKQTESLSSFSSNSDDFEIKEYPTSLTLPFPYSTGPYPQQAALMDSLLEGIPRSQSFIRRSSEQPYNRHKDNGIEFIHKTRILALESPTGTGKSLSLACAGLAWLDHEETLYYSESANTCTENSHKNDGNSSLSTPWKTQVAPLKRSSPTSVAEGAASQSHSSDSNNTGIDWLDSWKPPQEDDQERKEQLDRERELERHTSLVKALDELRLQLHPAEQNTTTNQNQRLREKRENLLRMALTKSRMEERKRARERNRKRKRNSLSMVKIAPELKYEDDGDEFSTTDFNNLDYDYDHDSSDESLKRKQSTPGTAQWLLETRGSNKILRPKPPQIVYAARTHSQLSQFVSEIRKTKWGKSLRVVALGSRGQGLCGALTKAGSSCGSFSEARLTEECLELRKKGGKTSCSHYASEESVSTLALHGMVEATDLEDLVALGRATKTCAYYAARAAVPHAQLVVLPYASLCSKSSREALGLELHSNTLVLVDEAHNLPDAISNLTSATLTQSIAEGARGQLTNYLKKYVDRLSPHHLRLLGDLKRLVRGLLASMNANSKPNHPSLRMLHQQGQQSDTEQQRYLLSSSEFLVSQKLETINLFPVLRYMKESKLSQKLLGFMNKPEIARGNSNPNNANETFRIPTHISPMSVVETFLEKLTYANNDDGQVIVDRGDTFGEKISNHQAISSRKEAHLRFCVLNPAVQARDDLWTAPRAVALVGGTLQPLDVMMRELIPGTVAEHAAKAQISWTRSSKAPMTNQSFSNPYTIKENSKNPNAIYGTSSVSAVGRKINFNQTKIYRSNEFWAFTCGHVVDSSQVFLQALTMVGGVSIDVRHKTRSSPVVTNAIGNALVQLRQKVHHGMVVFLPSYKYEAILVDAWKKPTKGTERSIWDQLQQITTVVREPKEASQVETTLAMYSRAASKSKKGALLLSVVGGKLSEGINFANDLCRCVAVVGLPFADRSDPLLQEKLKLVASATANAEGMSSKSAASDYYRSLCLRAVNQSVGRAIRHAKDWATIVLMDARYPSDEGIVRGLPSWLTDSTPSWRKELGDLENVLRRTNTFFEERNRI